MSDDIDLKQLGYTLHHQLIAGDVTASARIAEFLFPLTIARLQQRFSELDDLHLIDTAAEDAFLSYFDHPEQYNPAKLSLCSYLYMSAKGDLLNVLDRQRKELDRLEPVESVELERPDSECIVERQDDFDLEAQVLTNISPVWRQLCDILPDPVDQEIAWLIMEEVRETSVYADMLGISDRTTEEQAVIVKRRKDRVKKSLQRKLNRSELSQDE